MNLDLQIDRSARDSHPIYRQISDQIMRRIAEGSLPRGSRLPTIRELADRLAVTRVTAHNAYNELKARGWIDATVGRGTYVAGPTPHPPESDETLSNEITPDKVMADMTRLSSYPGTYSLACAEPDPDLYPGREFLRLLRTMEADAEELFHYSTSQGDLQLRQMISGLLAERGIRAHPDDILVTTGVTQGLSLATAALAEPGDKVLVERPTYLGFLSLLESYGLEPIGVSLDEEGPRLDELEKILFRERPRFFYTIPSFQNPTGTSMSEERRSRLISLAAQYGLMIVEDDIYGRLAYDSPPSRPLKARDDHNLVVYLDSFSKALLPGLRIGFMVPPRPLKEKLLSLLRARELCVSSLLQRGLAEFLLRGLFREHLERVLPLYRKRRDVLLESLTEMPEEVTWTTPQGGYSVWVSLPESGHFEGLYRTALSRGVAYTPGEVFLATPDKRKHLRLCYGAQGEDVIRKAVSHLSEIVKDIMARQSTRAMSSYGPKPIV